MQGLRPGCYKYNMRSLYITLHVNKLKLPGLRERTQGLQDLSLDVDDGTGGQAAAYDTLSRHKNKRKEFKPWSR